MSEIMLNNSNFEQEVNDENKLVIVDFFATWCGPCSMIAPILSEIANEYSDTVKVCKVNVDENQDLAIQYEVESIPTLVLFKNKKIVKTVVGFLSKSEIIEIISQYM